LIGSRRLRSERYLHIKWDTIFLGLSHSHNCTLHVTQQKKHDRKSYYKADRHYQLPPQVRAKSIHSFRRCKRIKEELEDKVNTKREKPRKKNRTGPGIFASLKVKAKHFSFFILLRRRLHMRAIARASLFCLAVIKHAKLV
jgi:hypothetical protein